MKFAKKTVEKLVMAYCLEKQTIRKKAGSFQILWTRYATCGSFELLEQVRMGQKHPEHWRVVPENTPGVPLAPMKKAG